MNAKLLLNLLGLAAVATLAYLAIGHSAPGHSQLEASFVHPEKLDRLALGTTARMPLEIHNPTSTTARIVGDSAC